eukprot:11622036-Alexandrium_andersonii.AAC.1
MAAQRTGERAAASAVRLAPSRRRRSTSALPIFGRLTWAFNEHQSAQGGPPTSRYGRRAAITLTSSSRCSG